MSEPTLVYDDDCGFCTWWAYRIAERSAVELVGFSDLTDELRERLPVDYEDCAHLVTDDEVYSCGESIEEAFLHSEVGGDVRPVVEFLRQFDEYGGLREKAYRLVADNRDALGKLVSADSPARRGRSD